MHNSYKGHEARNGLMKKVLRLTRNILLLLFIVALAIGLFLYAFYTITEKKLDKQNLLLEKNKQITLIQADTILTGTGEKTLRLLPLPQQYQFLEGTYILPQQIHFSSDTLQDTISYYLGKTADLSAIFVEKKSHLLFIVSDSIPEQGYDLEIQQDKITIAFSSIRGLHYALVSLKVLNKNYKGKLPCVALKDYPDLDVRGLLLDISNNKVPSLSTLMDLVQKLSDLKYNHLQLYIEGNSFAYPSLRNVWEGRETPLQGDEISILDTFCKARFIDLVPNQNSPGQMSVWLAADEIGGITEKLNGNFLSDLIKVNNNPDTSQQGSIELLNQMTSDMLPFFSSTKYNVNWNAPVEQVHSLVTTQKKQMLMWADEELRKPEMITLLPKDLTLLVRGYESEYPFEYNCRILKNSGRRFMLCPGTSSWGTITGRTNNMLANIASAALNAEKYDAEGLLLTDWGDMGHWQYLPVSYAGYTVAASLSWNCKSMGNFPLADFLNNYIFRDSRSIMGDLALDMGRYRQFEEIPFPGVTSTMVAFAVGLKDRLLVNALIREMISVMTANMSVVAPEMMDAFFDKYENRQPFDYSGLLNFLAEKEALLNNTDLKTSDGEIIKNEYRNAIRLIRAGTQLQYYIQVHDNLSPKEQIHQLNELKTSLLQYLDENKKLWSARNKSGGYERSVAPLNKLILEIDRNIAYAEEVAIARITRRLMEKITTSAIILYLKYC
jgi:hypothetical protein